MRSARFPLRSGGMYHVMMYHMWSYSSGAVASAVALGVRAEALTWAAGQPHWRSVNRPFIRSRIVACLLLSLVAMAFAYTSGAPQEIGWLKELGASETFLAAKLTLAERKQIIRQVSGLYVDSAA